jgi:hypothetical protein
MTVSRGVVNMAASVSSGSARTVPVITLVEIRTLQPAVLSARVRASTTSKYVSGSISPPPSERGRNRR